MLDGRGDGSRRTTARRPSLTVTISCIFLLGLPMIGGAAGQDAGPLTRKVLFTSDPPGAAIWTIEGRTLTCTDAVTPGAVELKFHGENDIQKVRLRRFGYRSENVEVKWTDEKVSTTLNAEPMSFFIGDDEPLELKQLNDGVKEEFERTILADAAALRCVPLELEFVVVGKDSETGEPELAIVISLDRSFGGSAFRVASHAGTRDERRQKTAQVALDGGIAELLMRLRLIAAHFPALKIVQVSCLYSSIEAYLDTESRLVATPQQTPVQRSQNVYDPLTGNYHTQMQMVMETRTVLQRVETTEVEDRAVEKALTFVIPAAKIPDTTDKRVMSEAALAAGKVILKSMGN